MVELRGYVSPQVILVAFLAFILILNLLPVLVTQISQASPYMDTKDKALAYLFVAVFLISPALLILSYYNYSRQLGGGGYA